jgi:hypothetical protein
MPADPSMDVEEKCLPSLGEYTTVGSPKRCTDITHCCELGILWPCVRGTRFRSRHLVSFLAEDSQ